MSNGKQSFYGRRLKTGRSSEKSFRAGSGNISSLRQNMPIYFWKRSVWNRSLRLRVRIFR